MTHTLTYYHSRCLFHKNVFKPFVKKYFKDVKFLGFECGNYSPTIQISNWDEVKDILPKYAKPLNVE